MDNKVEQHSHWKTANVVRSQDHLKIRGQPVMERWETPYMRSLAEVIARPGGCVLEVGFGLGIASNFIQKNNPGIHVIVEGNAKVFESLMTFSNRTTTNIVPIFGMWEDVISVFGECFFDAILYDTYPLHHETRHTHQFAFIKEAHRVLKANGILTYCNLTSWGELRNNYDDKELFEKTQLRELNSCGFNRCAMKIINVKPEKDCEYYKHETIIVPSVEK